MLTFFGSHQHLVVLITIRIVLGHWNFLLLRLLHIKKSLAGIKHSFTNRVFNSMATQKEKAYVLACSRQLGHNFLPSFWGATKPVLHIKYRNFFHCHELITI